MVKISATVRRPDSDGKGKVVYLVENESGRILIESGVIATRNEMLNKFRPLIVHGLKILYCILESYGKEGKTFTLNDVAERFRKEETELHSYGMRIMNAGVNFAAYDDVAVIGRYFRSDFKTGNRYEGTDSDNILGYIWHIQDSLRKDGRVNTANSYRSVLNSLADYAGTGTYTLRDMDANFITGYDSFLNEKEIEPSTRAFYMRTLKTILNRAKEEGRCSIMGSWFSGINMSVGKVGVKSEARALGREALQKIEEYDLSRHPSLRLARDLFMFSFYCKGMELADIALLRRGNVAEDWLTYRKRRHGTEQRVRLQPKALKIIEHYSGMGSDYLFPLLEEKGPAYLRAVSNKIGIALRDLGRMMECPIPLSFSVSRYSWQTLANRTNLTETLISG